MITSNIISLSNAFMVFFYSNINTNNDQMPDISTPG